MLQNLGLDLSDCLVAEIAVVDPAGKIVHVNRKWKETAKIGMLSLKQSSLNYIGECESAIQRGCRDAVTVLSGLRAILNGAAPYFAGTYACPFNGSHHWFQVQISALEFNGKRHAVLLHVDVSALQRDPLTNLANRAMFDAQLDLAVSLARDACRRTGVIIVDMNRLKSINDVYGHRAGDEALLALATEVITIAGPDCLAARIGGDEFGVVLPANYDTVSAWRKRARFRSGIVCSIRVAGKPISISASVGLAVYPDDGASAGELLASADQSMYAQKQRLSVA